MINIFQPEVLCIGGYFERGGLSFKPLQKLVEEARYTRDVPQTVIKRANWEMTPYCGRRNAGHLKKRQRGCIGVFAFCRGPFFRFYLQIK
jgi:hypothetical protein